MSSSKSLCALVASLILLVACSLASEQPTKVSPGLWLDSMSPIDAPILELLQTTFAHDPDRKHIKTMLDIQESYDFNSHMSTTDILKRSGFEYEIHNSTSEDGYVTQLVRIINPLVKDEELKYPPVVFYAGQSISPALFLAASINKNRPVAWPRSEEWSYESNGSNRSLAITLTNNGYDVWLVPARGVDKDNRVRVSRRAAAPKGTVGPAPSKGPFEIGKSMQHHVSKLTPDFEGLDYWSFSNDEIIRFEFRRQLDLVIRITGQERLSLIPYSNGAFIAFAFLAYEPNYGLKHIDTLITVAPAVYVNKFNLVLGASGLLSHLTLPGWPFIEDHIDSLARGSFVRLCKSKLIRYSLCKFFLNNLYGHSDTFQTFFELSLLDYIGRPMSPNGLRQTLQASYSGQLRHYDHGLIGNLFIYGAVAPPEYRLESVNLSRTFVVSGDKDAIADTFSVKKFVSELGKQPECISVPGYNHLDMVAAWNVAERVNQPILNILEDRALELSYYTEDRPSKGPGPSPGPAPAPAPVADEAGVERYESGARSLQRVQSARTTPQQSMARQLDKGKSAPGQHQWPTKTSRLERFPLTKLQGDDAAPAPKQQNRNPRGGFD